MKNSWKIPRILVYIWSDCAAIHSLGRYEFTRGYRAVALRSSEEQVWLWIGNHKEFDRRFPA